MGSLLQQLIATINYLMISYSFIYVRPWVCTFWLGRLAGGGMGGWGGGGGMGGMGGWGGWGDGGGAVVQS
jgi:hypothetical protein